MRTIKHRESRSKALLETPSSKRKLSTFSIAVAILLPQCLVVQADTWPGFRGKTGTGVSGEKGLPTGWSTTKNVAWSTDLPGRGNSSPTVTSSRIYLTTQTRDTSLWVLSVDRKTGKIAWKKKVGSGVLAATGSKKLYAHQHNAATPTAVADDERVWAFFGTGLLVCLDDEGKIEWRRDLAKDHGAYDITFGMGSSPRLWGDRIFLSCMTKGASYILALDKATGKEAWKTHRKLPAKDDGPDAYSTPTVFSANGRTALLVAGSDHINAYDPASGEQLWISGGLTIDSPYGRIIASPAASDGVIVATSSKPGAVGRGHILGLRAGGSGDVTATHRLWRHAKSTPDSSTPVCHNGRVTMVSPNGVASALDLKSGRLLWRKRVGTGPYHASLVAGDGKIYFLNVHGHCTVVEDGPKGRILAVNRLPDDRYYSTPAISGGRIIFRGATRLVSVGKK